MVRRVATGRALQLLLAREPAQAAPQHRMLRDARESAVMPGDGVADLRQSRAGRHPDTAADERIAGRDLDVEPRAPAFPVLADLPGGIAMVEPGGDVRLVGRLVAREPDIAMDSEDR